MWSVFLCLLLLFALLFLVLIFYLSKSTTYHPPKTAFGSSFGNPNLLTIEPNRPVPFSSTNHFNKNILAPSNGQTDFIIQVKGTYEFHFNILARYDKIPPSAGFRSFGVFLNNNIAEGSNASVFENNSGVSAADLVIFKTSGFFKAQKGDVVQLRNTSSIDMKIGGSPSGEYGSCLYLKKIDKL